MSTEKLARPNKVSEVPAYMADVFVQMLEQAAEQEAEERAKERAELEKLARIDALTGLKNRRAFDEDLDSNISLLNRHIEDPNYKAGSLILIDLDDFKETNDTLGHQGGDEVLQRVATILHESIRESDSAYRMGGDEFAVLLGDSDEDHGMEVAKRIYESMSAVTHSTDTRVAASFGVGELAADYSSEAICKYTDNALYAAKEMKGTGMVPIVAASAIPY